MEGHPMPKSCSTWKVKLNETDKQFEHLPRITTSWGWDVRVLSTVTVTHDRLGLQDLVVDAKLPQVAFFANRTIAAGEDTEGRCCLQWTSLAVEPSRLHFLCHSNESCSSGSATNSTSILTAVKWLRRLCFQKMQLHLNMIIRRYMYVYPPPLKDRQDMRSFFLPLFEGTP